MPHRDLNGARAAFATRDVELSRISHSGISERNNESTNRHIKSVIGAGLDGVAISFALICVVVGAGYGWGVVLVMGVAVQLASGISMGFGIYLSEDAELQYIKRERLREEWELENHPEGELQEMVEIYVENGFSDEDATSVIGIMARYKEFFVDHMLVQELGLLPPSLAESPCRNGVIAALSFILFGSVPLISFLVFSQISWSGFNGSFLITVIATAIAVGILGAIKARYTHEPWWRRCCLALVSVALTAVAAYVLGLGLSKIITVDCLNRV
ncbi:hypothetical protein CAOG_06112 [Capsaspora owczarzaki ATCC 30864]|uniref:Integral membrane protein n=1 Tax=Capsaspora owczarzaki (strain ATCC 30864) TaxID=595528 RepID=A0A0D2UKU4_CAPO3|nr:hypothetical protein CAOG_06112 [Capsaspora owczarzaki ATCC 30864]KJE95686.1 hypothetical protein CAOG_006112 [Capsaspora owczarzaki ATCC 30864]|eukprot:XP_004345702.1 hypothetical protein CAOG_06112 [Capsaspora owczarzaki ATCC 30864]